MIPVSSIWRCFQGVIPSIIGTSDAHGTPNVTYASQVHLIDDNHVALSRQFFNKTSRNLDENPRACVEMLDPLTLQAYRIRLKFLRSAWLSTKRMRHSEQTQPSPTLRLASPQLMRLSMDESTKSTTTSR